MIVNVVLDNEIKKYDANKKTEQIYSRYFNFLGIVFVLCPLFLT